MSTPENVVLSATPGPTPSAHVLAAQLRVEEIRQMRQTIPNFVTPEAKGDHRRLTNVASVPPEFVELMAMAITNSSALVREETSPAEMRDSMVYADAYSPVVEELEALTQFLRFSIAAARHKAGIAALTTYALAQRLAKRKETAHLAPHVAAMRRALGRGRKAKVAAEPKMQAPASVAPPSIHQPS